MSDRLYGAWCAETEEWLGIKAMMLGLVILTSWSPNARGFAEDVCSNATDTWMGCSNHLCPDPESEFLVCETLAMLTTVVGQGLGQTGPGGSRSTMHFDATYLLAQAAGLSPREAYVIAQYAQAPDQGMYVHRGQGGEVVAHPDSCETNVEPACWFNSAGTLGVDRNNFTGGGVFFHFPAPPAGVAISNGLHPQVQDPTVEPFLNHVRRWVYGQGPLCVGGLTERSDAGDFATGATCFASDVRDPSVFLGRIPFVSEMGFLGFADWEGEPGEQTLITDQASGEATSAALLDEQMGPDKGQLVRLGIYLHVLADRVSHHRCVDASRLEGPREAEAGSIVINPIAAPIYLATLGNDGLAALAQIITDPGVTSEPDFFFEFSTQECDQLSHANRHTFETGTEQAALSDENRTTEAALVEVYAELKRFSAGRADSCPSLSDAAADTLFGAIVQALEVASAQGRIDALTDVARGHDWLPLPAHGGVSAEQWLENADTPACAGSAERPTDARPPTGSGGSWSGWALWLLGLAALLHPARCRVLLVLAIALAAPAQAFDYSLGPVDVSAQFTLATGVTWRLQKQEERFLAKTNIEGQQDLCAADDCLSFTGDPAPNQRLVNARGGYCILNGDNGNLNYDQGDIVYATTRFEPEIKLGWGDWSFKAGVRAYYDPVNADFDETHPNTRFQPATTPRPDRYVEDFAKGVRLGEIALNGFFSWNDRFFSLGIGTQNIRWGEANTLQFTTLSAINPPDATVIRMPGAELADLPIPVPSMVLSTDLTNSLALEVVWLWGWEPVIVDPPGSFMSTSDIAGGGQYAIAGLGQFSEDPDAQFMLSFPASLATDTSAYSEVLDEEFGYPSTGDEFGFRLAYFAEWLNQGTDLSFHYLRYHSRLPYASTFAAQDSCARDSGDFVTALAVCQGGTGPFDPLIPGEGGEILPLDTVKIFLDYPENIDMLGLSFNTNLGDWAVAGEVAHHIDHPIQVQIVDVIFASLQPAFPRQDLNLGLGTITDLLGQTPLPDALVEALEALTTAGVPQLTLPSADNALPSYLAAYRGQDIHGGQRIQGYIRRDLTQVVVNGLKIYRRNPFGAEQVILLLEGGWTHIHDMPRFSELQLEGGGDNTHASAGADGTGSNGEPDARRVNPTQQREGFATQDSWGYRSLVQLTYNQVFGRLTVRPTLLWQHDLKGTSPFPMQNFIEDRRFAWFFVDIDWTRNFKTQLSWQVYTGAKDTNLLADRDNAGFSLIYTF